MHHLRDEDDPIPDLVRTADLPSAVPRTPAPGLDPAPGLTRTLSVDLGPVPPTAAPTLARLTPNETAEALAAPALGPALGPDHMDTGAPVLLAPLPRTEEGAGTQLNPRLPTDHAHDLPEGTGAAARADANTPIIETSPRMN